MDETVGRKWNISSWKIMDIQHNNNSIAIIIFFFGPIGLLLLINGILIIFVVCKIGRNDSTLQNMPASTKQRQRKSAILFVKLSALMGLPWVMEIVSWAVGGEDHYWYFTDAINMLRSIFIFIIFCCKPKVWEMLKRNSTMSSSIRWFSRRIGRENVMFSTTKDQPEINQSSNAHSRNYGKEFQQSDLGTKSGIANSAFDAQEMQAYKTN